MEQYLDCKMYFDPIVTCYKYNCMSFAEDKGWKAVSSLMVNKILAVVQNVPMASSKRSTQTMIYDL